MVTGRVDAATITAASCAQPDVAAAVTAAATGDTVQIPAGTCTWTTSVTVGHAITVQGAGVGSTVINLDGVTATDYLKLGTTASRVTNIEWHLVSGDHVIYARGQGFRIDHNKFSRPGVPTANRLAIYVSGGTGVPHPTGVIDHNEFLACRIYMQADLRLVANEIWAKPSTIGNPDQTGVLYIEDNTFTYPSFLGNSIDQQYGGRLVARYNTITNSLIEIHSPQNGPDRGSRSWEIYNNTFTSTVGVFTCLFIRGGTGVAFNNACNGNYGSAIWMDNVRSFQAITGGNLSCNGAASIDGNQTLGWPCRDQIGRGQDSVATPCCVVPTTPQASEPAYLWNNTKSGVNAVPLIANCGSAVKPGGSCADIVAGRDYLLGTPRPGYVPYVYPHPLAGTAPPGLSPPTNLMVSP